MFAFGTLRPTRRPSLTPMIDVVFLLLVFFMLASRFGLDGVVKINLAGSGEEYSGPRRLIDIGHDELLLNGRSISQSDLAGEISALTRKPDDLIILRAGENAVLQRVIDVLSLLNGQGFANVVLVE